MMELPEAVVIANQLNKKVKGRRIVKVVTAYSPHKFAWYCGDPKNYEALLEGKMINKVDNAGAMVELKLNGTKLVFSDGAGIKLHYDRNELPDRHQLLIEFDNYTYLTTSIQMYGGIFCFKEEEFKNKYYSTAKEKPSPLSKKFNENYFNDFISSEALQNKSVKFLLATEQRIPGLGNGVLQDILFDANIHPKRKVKSLTLTEKTGLFSSIKNVLSDMIDKGGRDTEKDLFGNYGGYITKLSKNTVGKPCTKCRTIIKKENYMGGSIYYCGNCQRLK